MDHDLDVLAVQETKVDGEEETGSMVQRFTYNYYTVVSHALGTSAGCVLFVRKLPGLVIDGYFSCTSGRLVFCDFSYCNVQWRVFCIYAPNTVQERANFFLSLKHHLHVQKMIACVGDFNCVLKAEDRSTRRVVCDKSSDILAQITHEFELEDIAECFRGHGDVSYTHFQGTSHARLDRIYLSYDLVEKCQCYTVTAISYSDHCLVKCTVGRKKERNKFVWELWKLNAELLRDETFNENVVAALNSFGTDSSTKFGEEWELLKQSIKLKAIERSSVLRYEQKAREKDLTTLLEKFAKLECMQPGAYQQDMRAVKKKLEVFDEDRFRGALVRARAERLSCGETPTKRALGLEKKHSRRKQIEAIEYEGWY